MPELPEVETVRRGLERLIVKKIVKKSIVFDSQKSFPNDEESVAHFLNGASIIAVRRRAKVLMIDLSTNYSLVIHLKMTGQLVFRDSLQAFGAGHPNESLIGELPDRSTRVLLEFLDGGQLFFNDQRKFGWMKLVPTSEIPELPFMKKVGPEPLEKNTTIAECIMRIRRRNNTRIKAAILDQTTIAGIGNIYADESLWVAKIHPATRVKMLSDEDLERIFDANRAVMTLAIERGGSTNKNYVNAEGKRGSYMDFAKVFRREGQLCERDSHEIIKFKCAGRGTHICPVCQVEITE